MDQKTWSFKGYFLKTRIFLEGLINVDSKDKDILQGPINIEFKGFFEDKDIFCTFYTKKKIPLLILGEFVSVIYL